MPHKYALQGVEAEREIDLIERSLHWPRFPWLPIKRTEDQPVGMRLGLINGYDIAAVQMESEGARIRVFDVNLWDLEKYAKTDPRSNIHTVDLDDLPVLEEYASERDLVVEGGWRGD